MINYNVDSYVKCLVILLKRRFRVLQLAYHSVQVACAIVVALVMAVLLQK